MLMLVQYAHGGGTNLLGTLLIFTSARLAIYAACTTAAAAAAESLRCPINVSRAPPFKRSPYSIRPPSFHAL